MEQARHMLKQWLAKLNHLCEDNNVSLAVFPNCKDLPRLVFALLCSPLLRSIVSGDDWASAQVLLTRYSLYFDFVLLILFLIKIESSRCANIFVSCSFVVDNTR
jgi:hypothetical protein